MNTVDTSHDATVARLRTDVTYLASPALDGREPGTAGHELAARYIEERVRELALEPLFTAGHARPIRGAAGARNLCGQLPGTTNRRILVGAHYDHFQGILGADDNAAAVAIGLEVARRLQPWSGRAQVVFAFFDQEEPPNFQSSTMGSMQFVNDCPFPLADLDCAIVMDLCGHAIPFGECPQALVAMGAENQAYLGEAVGAVSTDPLPVLPVPHAVEPDLSDHVAFRRRGAPFLFLTCGRWEHYHARTDTIEVLDLPKMGRIAMALEGLVRHIDAAEVDAVARRTPWAGFDREAARGFRRLTGFEVPPDRGVMVAAARDWLRAVGG
jgi:hypothetical protein